MDKNVYETYEFLPTNEDQLFVLQDGTVVSLNKDIQFVTQAKENGNENTNNINQTVFSIPSQQYYVEFEENSTEIISLNDQFAIENTENNDYSSSYLIQPENIQNADHQEMEQDTDANIDPQKLDAQQIQQINIEALNGIKQTSNFSEITLTDAQYQILEQKGWILLEANDKTFVLNTLGLHDITDNEILVQRLRDEFQEIEASCSQVIEQEKIENELVVPEPIKTESQSDIVEYFVTHKPALHSTEVSPEDSEIKNDLNIDEDMDLEIHHPMSMQVPVENEDFNNDLTKKCDTIKIKTKYTFTDIPDKIFLGKTVNGKNLFAKVKKKYNSQSKIDQNTDIKSYASFLLDSGLFINLLQDWLRRAVLPDKQTLNFAQAVVTQLIRLPNLTQTITQNKLIITKVTMTIDENGQRKIDQPTIVAGFMELHGQDYIFNHSPNLIRDILQDAETSATENTAKGFIDLFHIHISESKYPGGKVPETAIHLSKRKIPIDALLNSKRKHPIPSFACATCGTVFKSQQLLTEHQQDECIEIEDELTIDCSEDIQGDALYKVVNDGKKDIYICTLCNTQFTRLYNCKKHIRTHKAGIEKKLKMYKCKICSNTYFHVSTLSKHLLKAHIQTKSSQ